MNLLLDTHVLIRWDEGRRIAGPARRAIEAADGVYVSAAQAVYGHPISQESPMRTGALTGWIGGVLVVALSGCSGEPERQPEQAAQGQPALAEIDACALLQPAEIQEATGAEPGVGARPDVPDGAPPMCHWAPVQLLVSPAGWKTYEQFDSANRRTLEEGYDAANYQRLDGPGRFAVLLKDAGMIQAVGERHMVQVAAQPAKGRDTLEVVTRLAGLVLERLE